MKTLSPDQAALRILLDGKLTEKQRQAQLSAAKARNVLDNRVECPDCGHKGPHEDNGARGSELTYLCVSCHSQFEASV
jgi:transposase-like protein